MPLASQVKRSSNQRAWQNFREKALLLCSRSRPRRWAEVKLERRGLFGSLAKAPRDSLVGLGISHYDEFSNAVWQSPSSQVRTQPHCFNSDTRVTLPSPTHKSSPFLPSYPHLMSQPLLALCTAISREEYSKGQMLLLAAISYAHDLDKLLLMTNLNLVVFLPPPPQTTTLHLYRFQSTLKRQTLRLREEKWLAWGYAADKYKDP